MEKIKNIITGILSGAVFFMAMQVGVAQEKVVASDNVGSSFKETALLRGTEKTNNEPTTTEPSTAGLKGLLTQGNYLFKYTGTPGNESDPSLWEHVEEGDIEECEGDNFSCAVWVKADFTTESGGQRIIDASSLPSGLMPVTQSPASALVPDPAAAGGSPSQPYVDENLILNQD